VEWKIPGQEKQGKESLDHVMLNLNRVVASPTNHDPDKAAHPLDAALGRVVTCVVPTESQPAKYLFLRLWLG
jgi:hypothetical protein